MRDEPLTEAAGRIADGEIVDWSTMTVTLSSDLERAVATELELVARIAAGHRRLHTRPLVPPAPPADVILDRARWGHLELRDVVGRGSYGTVYRAWDTRLEREVALKLFHRASNPDAVMNEGRMLARIRHQHVVTVYGADVIDGVAGIWMEFLHGPTLDDTVRVSGPMPARRAAAIGAEVAQALAAIHQAHLLHCDVKAQNVVSESTGRAVLMDMGAGRVMPESQPDDHLSDVAGTPRYMAPELFEPGATATTATDIYSLGVLLYYLASGKFPVDGRTVADLKQAHLEGRATPLEAVRPGLPVAYLGLVTRALDPNPARRPASAEDFVRVLAPIAAPPAAGPRLWKWAALMLSVTLLALAVWGRGLIWPAPPRVIAVLPIRNLTGDSSKAYVADGLTEVLISNLARVRSLRVPSFGAVASLRDTSESPAAVAMKLGAQYLLAGSIIQLDGRFRMTVQLIDPRSGAAIWGEEIAREAAGMMSAQAEVARLVANKLALSLSSEETRGLTQAPIDPRAQDAYLAGLTLTRAAPLGQDDAADRFRLAVEIEHKFAAAWAMLGLTELTLMEQSASTDRPARAAEIKQMAQRAIALDPSLANGYAALGTVQFYHERDFKAADETFRKALTVDPSNAFSRQRFSMFLAAEGRTEAAVQVGRDAELLEPMVPERAASLGMLYYYARDYEHALAQMDRALGLAPGFARAYYGRGRILSAQGRHDEALAAFDEALRSGRNAAWLAEVIRAYVAAGRSAEAAPLRAELADRERRGEGYGSDLLAYLAAAEGRTDDAFRILNEAVDRGMVNLLWIKVDPRADPLRSDPRFTQLVARIGLDR
jgi:serine/threonine-protein kinase